MSVPPATSSPPAGAAPPPVSSRAARARQALALLRRHGIAEAARRAAYVGRAEARLRLWLDAEHVWYSLDLDGSHPQLPLPEGTRLVEGGPQDLERAVAASLTSNMLGVPWMHERGVKLWVVYDGAEAVFACWVFADEVSTSVAPGGWVAVPAGARALDESYTAPGHKGRGIAPAAWSAIASVLEAQGVERLIGTVDGSATPAHRAMEKAGFTAVARMVTRRRFGRAYMRIEPLAEPAGSELRRLWTKPASA